MATSKVRGAWNSKLGFILAASGSAIGLGNIVFFSANAYAYGGGAFYLPYFIALFVLGIPVMILEFGLGTMTGRAFPEALYRVAGKKAEFVGWWSLGSALFITMYYITLLGWGAGMLFGALGSLFEPGATAPFAPMQEPTAAASAQVFFFDLIATWWPFLGVAAIWGANLTILWRGTETIERAVRIFVPLMWLFMIGLIIRGLTLEGGPSGVLYLFTPDIEGILQPGVWKGAFAQIFFSLSLGLGTMTAYASYLPKDADQVNNSLLVSFMNCGFEFIAGVAIFSLLFAFAINPGGGTTLSLSFFAIPQGISEFPWGVKVFGFLFFLLFLMAGLTSSISLIESPVSALIDKLKMSRGKILTWVAVPGMIGSLCFALPTIIDPGLGGNGTLGLTLLDVLDHWAFNYSLLTVGFLECIMVGWVLGADNLRRAVNENSVFTLGRWFEPLIRYVAPLLLGTVIVWNLYNEFTGVFYGSDYPVSGLDWIPYVVPIVWLAGTLVMASYLTFGRSFRRSGGESVRFGAGTSAGGTTGGGSADSSITRKGRDRSEGDGSGSGSGGTALCVGLLALLFVSLVAPRAARAQYVEQDEILVAGQPVTLSLSEADTLMVTYRPGSSISHTEELRAAGGQLEWTPAQAGIAALTTPGGPTQNVSIRFARLPVLGVIVLIVAGGLLFGGIAYASNKLFGREPTSAVVDHRPDT